MEETTTVTIEVKQRHIDRGVKDDCDNCAVALAIEDVVGDPGLVCDSGVWFGEHECVFPQEVKDFIHAFDEGRPVKPITFPLDVPTWLLAQGSHA